VSAAGAVLAGGLGRRMAPGPKAAAALAGRPLVSYPLAALSEVCDPVAVVAKSGSGLPALDGGVLVWEEPPRPRHPLCGIVHALERAGGPVLVCAADMPFVTAQACRALLEAVSADAVAVVATDGDDADARLQPLFGVYLPSALDGLRGDLGRDLALTATVEALSPVRVPLPADVLGGVNTPQELAAAERRLSA
jgi:molybdenum cofactor guanylyltransferase